MVLQSLWPSLFGTCAAAFCRAGSVGTDEEDPIMTIPPDLEAQILRYYHVEKWRVGTIARQLRVHPETVARVLAQAGLPRIGPPQRPSKIDPYLPFIHETLANSRAEGEPAAVMVWERGYRGGQSQFRDIIACHRPRPTAEAYLRLRTLPGGAGAGRLGPFRSYHDRPGAPRVDGLRHGAQLLAPDLPALLSRRPHGELPARPCRRVCRMERRSEGILYDNLQSAVLERHGDAIRFHPTLLDFAGHYRYEPRPVAVARGNEKGRVERAIRFVRDAFFAARRFADLDDLNAQAEAWCNGQAADRRCLEDQTRSVADVFAEEAPRLLKQPERARIRSRKHSRQRPTPPSATSGP